MEENDKKETFRVQDRRRFDSDGNERAGVDSAKASPTPPQSPPSSRKASPIPEPEAAPKPEEEFIMDDQSEPSEMEFSSFIMSLATQALVQLGDMKPPPGLEIPIDVLAARQTIDILAMLQGKTRGNLNPTEARLIEDILHNLRVSYVKHAR